MRALPGICAGQYRASKRDMAPLLMDEVTIPACPNLVSSTTSGNTLLEHDKLRCIKG